MLKGRLLMITNMYDQDIESSRNVKMPCRVFIIVALTLLPVLLSPETSASSHYAVTRSGSSQISYRNPRVYNLEISFEMAPDPAKIDRDRDLKVWIPIPREWDSQKNVQIISVQPEPHGRYTDPEYGNKIYYWDFGKYPERPSYRVDIRARLLSYEVETTIDPSDIKPYDKTSEEYELYTKSGYTVHITPKVKELAKVAVGDETNPYLKAQKILAFVHDKIKWFQGMDRSLEHMLSSPKIDEKSGEEYYNGDCTHFSALFVALCRSEGIPARCVYGRIGWAPHLNEGNSRMAFDIDTALSPDGFAGAQHHGLGPHMWAEYFLPGTGWIPVDANVGWHRAAHPKVIMSYGRDIILGPDAPRQHHNGYGFQWVPIHGGRVEGMLSAVYNIEKIHNARSNVYHTLDPFPADALISYKNILDSTDKNGERLANWRSGILDQIDYHSRDIPNRYKEFSKLYMKPVWVRSLQYRFDEYVCHMLHRILGDERFSRLLKEYEILRGYPPSPVETARFVQLAGNIYGELLEWFFDQWKKTNGLPHLKLDKVSAVRAGNGWKIKGRLIQTGESFWALPLEFSLKTEEGRESFSIWQRDRITDFEYQTENRPLVLKVDPNNDILKIQRMPARLSRIEYPFSNYAVIYGTVSEAEANKTAAERFCRDYFGLSPEVIKPDTEITNDDLNAECIVLFGRPATNKIAKRLENVFPIRFKPDSFTYKGISYTNRSQGLAQVIEHPFQANGILILYAGLSPQAMLQFGDLYIYGAPNSFVIYDGDKQLCSGNWKVGADLEWIFEN
jgi:transglutaminase-like putative cysteine protease